MEVYWSSYGYQPCDIDYYYALNLQWSPHLAPPFYRDYLCQFPYQSHVRRVQQFHHNFNAILDLPADLDVDTYYLNQPQTQYSRNRHERQENRGIRGYYVDEMADWLVIPDAPWGGTEESNNGLRSNNEERNVVADASNYTNGGQHLVEEEAMTARSSSYAHETSLGTANGLNNNNLEQITTAAAGSSLFRCPVCLSRLKEEMSTTCGHIFCQECIYMALRVRRKCPTCRKSLTLNDIHRVFLPSLTEN